MSGIETLGAIESLLRSIRTVGDMLKELNLFGGKSRAQIAELAQRVATIQEEALRAQEETLALRKENLELKEKIRQLDEFNADAKEYELVETNPGSFAYALKKRGKATGKPSPYLCAHCFGERKRSLLQFAERQFYVDLYKCQRCGGAVRVPNDNRPTVMTVPRRDPLPGY